MNTTLALLFLSASQTFNLPAGLLSATCWVESSHNVNAVHIDDNGADSIGVCQLRLSTARALGFRGTAERLKNPSVNVYYAAKYLSHQYKRYHGGINPALSAYNAGTHLVGRDGRTKNFKYVLKVRKAWAESR